MEVLQDTGRHGAGEVSESSKGMSHWAGLSIWNLKAFPGATLPPNNLLQQDPSS